MRENGIRNRRARCECLAKSPFRADFAGPSFAFGPKIAIIAESLGVRIRCVAQVRPPVTRWALRPFFFAETVGHLG
ncbi:hypothetical protein DO72_4067 [Burkholderia pseudomallei]|nr:hypothetical protein DO72_4067 [Burkholderia pseudomallei]KOT10423.1 hypothetical protein DM77_2926 [Burkholderia mallei]